MLYEVDDTIPHLEEIIPGVTVSNGKYDCSKLIAQLKDIKSKINYKDYAINEEYYKYFQ